MKTKIAAALLFFQGLAYAQLDRAGNAIESEDTGSSGGALGVVVSGVAIGAIIGMAWAKYQQSQGKAFATDGGAIVGGLIGLLAWPLISILTK